MGTLKKEAIIIIIFSSLLIVCNAVVDFIACSCTFSS